MVGDGTRISLKETWGVSALPLCYCSGAQSPLLPPSVLTSQLAFPSIQSNKLQHMPTLWGAVVEMDWLSTHTHPGTEHDRAVLPQTRWQRSPGTPTGPVWAGCRGTERRCRLPVIKHHFFGLASERLGDCFPLCMKDSKRCRGKGCGQAGYTAAQQPQKGCKIKVNNAPLWFISQR